MPFPRNMPKTVPHSLADLIEGDDDERDHPYIDPTGITQVLRVSLDNGGKYSTDELDDPSHGRVFEYLADAWANALQQPSGTDPVLQSVRAAKDVLQARPQMDFIEGTHDPLMSLFTGQDMTDSWAVRRHFTKATADPREPWKQSKDLVKILFDRIDQVYREAVRRAQQRPKLYSADLRPKGGGGGGLLIFGGTVVLASLGALLMRAHRRRLQQGREA